MLTWNDIKNPLNKQKTFGEMFLIKENSLRAPQILADEVAKQLAQKETGPVLDQTKLADEIAKQILPSIALQQHQLLPETPALEKR